MHELKRAPATHPTGALALPFERYKLTFTPGPLRWPPPVARTAWIHPNSSMRAAVYSDCNQAAARSIARACHSRSVNM